MWRWSNQQNQELFDIKLVKLLGTWDSILQALQASFITMWIRNVSASSSIEGNPDGLKRVRIEEEGPLYTPPT